MVIQVPDVRAAMQKPQQFVNDGFEVQFLRCHRGKTRCEIEAHLVTKETDGACSGSIWLACALVEDIL